MAGGDCSDFTSRPPRLNLVCKFYKFEVRIFFTYYRFVWGTRKPMINLNTCTVCERKISHRVSAQQLRGSDPTPDDSPTKTKIVRYMNVLKA